jgi:hypothetical protein
MLLLPFVLGTWAGGWTWWSVPLLVAWLAGYGVSYYALLSVKSRRPKRFRRQLLTYAAVLAVAGVVSLTQAPWLLVAAAVFVPFWLANTAFARARQERHLINGLVSVTAACLMVFVAFGYASGETWSQLSGLDWQTPRTLFDLCWLYLAGTVLFVKTMIREAGDPRYLQLSWGFHAVALLVVVRIDVWLVVPFGIYLLRAVLLPRLTMRPAQVGALEMVNSLLLLAFAGALVID